MESDVRSIENDVLFRTLDTADTPTIVADLGDGDDAITVDVTGDTLILVNESSGEQQEVTLPEGEARTFMQNGVLTIEVEE